jgi:hypothetical protein
MASIASSLTRRRLRSRGRYRVDLYATGRWLNGIERQLRQAATIDDATRLYEEQAVLYHGRLVMRSFHGCPMRRKRRQAAQRGYLVGKSPSGVDDPFTIPIFMHSHPNDQHLDCP